MNQGKSPWCRDESCTSTNPRHWHADQYKKYQDYLMERNNVGKPKSLDESYEDLKKIFPETVK